MLPRYLEQSDTSEDLSAIADKIGALDAMRPDVARCLHETRASGDLYLHYDNADRSWTAENNGEILIGRPARTIVDAWSPEGLVTKVEEPLAPAKK